MKRLGRSWLGRIIDQDFLAEIGSTGIDACGENGGYHSFAFDGPIVTRQVRWIAGAARLDGSFIQLDVRLDDENQNFRDDVALSFRVDPRPTLENLALSTGLPYESVVHHALARYASSGAEALLAIEPYALRELISARKASDWRMVGAIIDWIEAGLQSPNWPGLSPVVDLVSFDEEGSVEASGSSSLADAESGEPEAGGGA